MNLTSQDLGRSEHRATLFQLLTAAARATDADTDGLLDDWERLHWGSLDVKPGEDPDEDGRTNLEEHAFGSDPRTPDLTPSLQIRPVRDATGQLRWQIAYPRRAGAWLTYVPTIASSLPHWTPANPTWLSPGPTRNRFDGTGTETASFLVQPDTAPAVGFLRLLVQPRPR